MLDLNLLSDIREARKQGFTLEDILVAIALNNSGISKRTVASLPVDAQQDESDAGVASRVRAAVRKPRKVRKSRPAVRNTDSKRIRAWAVENGLTEAGQRGRLSLAVHEAYTRAHA